LILNIRCFFLSFFAIAIITTSLGVIVNELITASYITISEAGTIVSARSLGYLIGAFASTKLFYKINYSKILPLYFLTIALLLLVLNFNSSLMTYIIIFLFFGMLKNLVTVGGNQIISLTFVKGLNNNVINYVHALYGLGTFISPLLSGFIVTKFNISILYTVFISLSLGVSLYFVFSSNKINFSIKKKAKLESESSFRNISLLIMFFALYASCEIFIGTWGPYLLTNNGVNKNIVYLSNALFWISLATSKIILIPLTNRLKNIKVIILSIVISMACILMLMIENNNMFSLIAMVLLGLSMGNIVPTVMKYITINRKVTSADTAWCFVGAGVGGVLSSKLFAIILQVNSKATILFCVACFLSLLVVFYFLTKNKKSSITLKA
jgi:fucose permease